MLAINLDVGLLLKSIEYASEKHRDQRRKNKFGAPFINHPIGVAHILWAEAGIHDIDVLQAAILHDVVEDTDASHEDLIRTFGQKVANIVKDVTDDKSMTKDQRKRQQVIHAKGISREAKLVKLADKLYNLRDLKNCPPSSWDVKRVQGYFVWSQAVVKSLSGTNQILEEALQKLFETGSFLGEGLDMTPVASGKVTITAVTLTHDCVPRNTDLTEFLEAYYAAMSIAGKTEDNNNN